MINQQESLPLSCPAVTQQRKIEWELSLLHVECHLKWCCPKVYPLKWFVFNLPYAWPKCRHGSRAGGTRVTDAEAHLDAYSHSVGRPIEMAHWSFECIPPSEPPIVMQTSLPVSRTGTWHLCVAICPILSKGWERQGGSVMNKLLCTGTLSSKDCPSMYC